VQRPNGDFAALTAGGTVLRIPKDGTSATSAGYLERRTWDPPSLPVSETLLAASDGNFYGIAEGHSIFRVVPAQFAGGGSGTVDIVASLGAATARNPSFSLQRNVRNLAGLIESGGYLYGVVNRVAPNGAALGGGSLFRGPLAISGTTVAPDPQAVTGSGATLLA
jgi:hypothetical protein